LLARRLDLSTSPSRQDQFPLPLPSPPTPCLRGRANSVPYLLNYSALVKVPGPVSDGPVVALAPPCKGRSRDDRVVPRLAQKEARHPSGPGGTLRRSSTRTMRLATSGIGWVRVLWVSNRAGGSPAAGRLPIYQGRPDICNSRVAGGAEGIRTPDLRRAKAALSQLSYGPAGARGVGQPGIEPGTSVLSGLRSSRLSYWPPPGRRV
jgi:hypothetical protein